MKCVNGYLCVMAEVTMIVAVCGLPGSGKSYFATRLAKKLDAVYIASDEVRKQIYSIRTYSEEEKLSVYEEMTRRAVQAVAEKKAVVVDATFYRKTTREMLSQAVGSSPRWIEVRANESIVQERLAKRRTHSEADFEVYMKVKGQWEPLTGEYLALESKRDNIDEMLDQAIQYIRHDP